MTIEDRKAIEAKQREEDRKALYQVLNKISNERVCTFQGVRWAPIHAPDEMRMITKKHYSVGCDLANPATISSDKPECIPEICPIFVIRLIAMGDELE